MKKQATVKGVLIDPEKKEIKEIDVPASKEYDTLYGLYEIIGCSVVECCYGCLESLPSSPIDDMWINEEGWFAEEPSYKFVIPGLVPIVGKCVILNSDADGNSMSHTLIEKDLEFLRENVKFYKGEVKGYGR